MPDSNRKVAVCKKVAERFLKVYRDLLPFHKTISKQDFFAEQIDALKTLGDKNCDDALSRQKIQMVLTQFLNFYDRKTCVLYKSSGQGQQFLLDGFQKSLQFQNIAVPPILDLVSRSLEDGLSQCVFSHGAGTIISFLSSSENTKIAFLTDKMRLTTFFANSPDGNLVKSKFQFVVAANRNDLAAATVSQANKNGWSKLAIIFPTSEASVLKITDFTSQENIKNSIFAMEPYRSDQFDSIDRAVKKILQLDPLQRPEEFKAAFEKQKETQKDSKKSLGGVLLPPKVEFDALLVLDNFRILRHVIKLLQFYDVRNLNLVGVPDWRGEGLLTPPEKFLERAFFVDTLPTAAILGRILGPALHPKDEFFPLDRYDEIDFTYQGFQIGEKVAPFLLTKKKFERRKIFEFFHPGKSWPYYIFSVNSQKLIGKPL